MPDDEKDAPEEIGIPAKLRVTRHYTLSPEALAQRQAAARSPKKSEAMQGNKNSWKHGKYAKGFISDKIRPCLSSCPDYPCELVEDGSTKPGGACMDKQAVLEMYHDILDAVKDPKTGSDGWRELCSIIAAEQLQILRMLIEDIQRDGTMAKRKKYDKDGNDIGYEIVPHPSLLALPKMILNLGITPDALMITPKARTKHEDDANANRTLADVMSNLGKSLVKKPSGDDE